MFQCICNSHYFKTQKVSFKFLFIKHFFFLQLFAEKKLCTFEIGHIQWSVNAVHICKSFFFFAEMTSVREKSELKNLKY